MPLDKQRSDGAKGMINAIDKILAENQDMAGLGGDEDFLSRHISLEDLQKSKSRASRDNEEAQDDLEE